VVWGTRVLGRAFPQGAENVTIFDFCSSASIHSMLPFFLSNSMSTNRRTNLAATLLGINCRARHCVRGRPDRDQGIRSQCQCFHCLVSCKPSLHLVAHQDRLKVPWAKTFQADSSFAISLITLPSWATFQHDTPNYSPRNSIQQHLQVHEHRNDPRRYTTEALKDLPSAAPLVTASHPFGGQSSIAPPFATTPRGEGHTPSAPLPHRQEAAAANPMGTGSRSSPDPSACKAAVDRRRTAIRPALRSLRDLRVSVILGDEQIVRYGVTHLTGRCRPGRVSRTQASSAFDAIHHRGAEGTATHSLCCSRRSGRFLILAPYDLGERLQTQPRILDMVHSCMLLMIVGTCAAIAMFGTGSRSSQLRCCSERCRCAYRFLERSRYMSKAVPVRRPPELNP
jgi:hypothetical protein